MSLSLLVLQGFLPIESMAQNSTATLMRLSNGRRPYSQSFYLVLMLTDTRRVV